MIIRSVGFMNNAMTSIERSGFVSSVQLPKYHQLYSMGTEDKEIYSNYLLCLRYIIQYSDPMYI